MRYSAAEVLRDIADTLHPLIRFGFGVEFSQPAMLAEALAQAAIRPTYLDPYFFQADQKAERSKSPSGSLVDILDGIRRDKRSEYCGTLEPPRYDS